MTYFFTLQQRRIERKFVEIGIPPVLAYIFMALGFVILSKLLFYKTEYADWIYVLLGATTVLKLSERSKTDYLQSIFSSKDFYRIRFIENTVTVLPFVAYLGYENRYLIGLGLFILGALLSRIKVKQGLNFTIPTPFWKFPFEFITGFRKSIGVLIGLFFLTFKGIEVGNFNLGLFSLGFLFLVSMSFYLKPEEEYFVWIHSCDAKVFLRKKIVQALICVSWLSLPIFLALSIAFMDKIAIIAGVQVVGYIFLIAMILAKYSAFPSEINLPQSILLGLSLWFPPMMLIVIPIFYAKAKRKLISILEW